MNNKLMIATRLQYQLIIFERLDDVSLGSKISLP